MAIATTSLCTTSADGADAGTPQRWRQSAGFGGGTQLQREKRAGEHFEKNWRESEERAERMRRQYEHGQWSGSPQDIDDLVGPNRSGGLDKVTSGPKLTGLLRDEGWGNAAVPARPMPTNGNGNGHLSGGAAMKVPTGVSGDW